MTKEKSFVDGKAANITGITAKDLIARGHDGHLIIPLREVTSLEGIALGFRQELLSYEDIGDVTCGAGCGTDFIILRWGERRAFVRGSDLLKAWVLTFNPDDAARMK